MTEVSTPLLYGLAAMAAYGFILTLLRFFKRSSPPEENPLTELHSQFAPPGNAPRGYKWVLVPDRD